jgi:glycosyltransferase involved in cell wall biosynthesis
MQPASIVTTVLNEVEDIERLAMSLLAQEPVAAEVIVVDGGSTDGTWERLLALMATDRRLVAIRDETCNLKNSPGPIARGRNVAIRAAKSEVIACADAGCRYAPDWLKNLTAPLVSGEAEYALGGSCIDPEQRTAWDVAAAPFFGIRLGVDAPTKSCTARSMAFTKKLWGEIGGFPEHLFLGEDTVFDLEARQRTKPAFIPNAKALYRPRFTLRSAISDIGRYSRTDGQTRVRRSRLIRNAERCVAQVAALVCLHWTVIPWITILTLEVWFAVRLDWRDLGRQGLKAIAARFIFSIAVPWVVTVNHIRGLLVNEQLLNRQNQVAAERNKAANLAAGK